MKEMFHAFRSWILTLALCFVIVMQGLKTRDSRTATGADAYAGADEFDDADY